MYQRHIAFMLKMAIVLFSLLSIIGCDKGFSYHPDGWKAQGKGGGWKKEWRDLTIRTWRIFGLNGSGSVSVEFEITNKTEMAIELQSAELIAKGRSYSPAQLSNQGGDSSWRIIQPKTARRLPFKWSLGEQEPVPVSLGSEPHIILSFREGSQAKKISIHYISR